MNTSTTPAKIPNHRTLLWDVFCAVVDNYGDIGVCWRLASTLAQRGHTVRLWVDDPSALHWMAPQGLPGIYARHWQPNTEWPTPADVVIESFGCALPSSYISRMAERARQGCAPIWINLEHLSAEAFAGRNHRLPSPQLTGAGTGLNKWFFYPGFTPETGGLLREQDLAKRQALFDANRWRAAHNLSTSSEERTVSLFCYPHAPVDALIHALASEPTVLFTTYGIATQRTREILGPSMRTGALRAVALPALSQIEFDHLLWACDINCVRGEDSWVRAIWAAKPFLWQIYPQADGAHTQKLNAFLELFVHGAAVPLAKELRTCIEYWNGLNHASFALPTDASWPHHCTHWRNTRLQQPDLTTQLIEFVHTVYANVQPS